MSFRFIPTLLVLISASAFATDYQSPRVAGMGGAGHAAPILNDGIYMNPAMIALLPAYSVSLSQQNFSGPDNTEPHGLIQNASIQDGTNNLFAAGLGYTRKTYGRQVNVGASTRIFSQYGIGIGGKFLYGSTSRLNAQDATISAVGVPLPWLSAGLVIDNALQTNRIKESWNEYREITLGLKFNIQKILLVYADPHVIPGKPGQTMGYEIGAELPIMSDLYIRAGMNKNSFQPGLAGYGNGHGFGIGWAFPRISFDAALTRTFTPARTNGLLFSATVL